MEPAHPFVTLPEGENPITVDLAVPEFSLIQPTVAFEFASPVEYSSLPKSAIDFMAVDTPNSKAVFSGVLAWYRQRKHRQLRMRLILADRSHRFN